MRRKIAVKVVGVFGNDTITIADVSALERRDRRVVYALYGLTPEEIKLMEGSAK